MKIPKSFVAAATAALVTAVVFLAIGGTAGAAKQFIPVPPPTVTLSGGAAGGTVCGFDVQLEYNCDGILVRGAGVINVTHPGPTGVYCIKAFVKENKKIILATVDLGYTDATAPHVDVFSGFAGHLCAVGLFEVHTFQGSNLSDDVGFAFLVP